MRLVRDPTEAVAGDEAVVEAAEAVAVAEAVSAVAADVATDNQYCQDISYVLMLIWQYCRCGRQQANRHRGLFVCPKSVSFFVTTDWADYYGLAQIYQVRWRILDAGESLVRGELKCLK